jgi:cytochrome c
LQFHATERVVESPLASAPKLRDPHLRYDVKFLSEALVEDIVTAHPNMPQFEFDSLDAEAIIAYMKSLEWVVRAYEEGVPQREIAQLAR